jgi:uncharacterized protein (DUF1697 family)
MKAIAGFIRGIHIGRNPKVAMCELGSELKEVGFENINNQKIS